MASAARARLKSRRWQRIAATQELCRSNRHFPQLESDAAQLRFHSAKSLHPLSHDLRPNAVSGQNCDAPRQRLAWRKLHLWPRFDLCGKSYTAFTHIFQSTPHMRSARLLRPRAASAIMLWAPQLPAPYGTRMLKKLCGVARLNGSELVNFPSAAKVFVAMRGQLASGAATLFVETT